MVSTPKPAPKLIATVDVALFTLSGGELCVALAERDREPHKGELALIGGYVHTDEDADTLSTARRVLTQKTGVSIAYLEQLYTFSGMTRDARGWSISVAYFAMVPEATLNTTGSVFSLVPVNALPALPFDHNEIVQAAVKRLRNKASYSSLPVYLLPEQFTLPELQAVYEKIMGLKFDASNFRRKIKEIVDPVEGKLQGKPHRPSQFYRRKSDLTEFTSQISSSL